MEIKAVIFDLFGTLVDGVPLEKHNEELNHIAEVLSIDSDIFLKLWSETSEKRIKGYLKNFKDNIEFIMNQVGVIPEEEKIERGLRIRMDMVRKEFVLRKDTVDTLTTIRQKGCRTALISDCTHESTMIWPDTPLAPLFDVTVFSCQTGVRKPNPRIYRIALEQLEVIPDECLYIGDGGSKELTGALQVGMNPVLLSITGENENIVYRINTETDTWDGPVISSLTEVLALVEKE